MRRWSRSALSTSTAPPDPPSSTYDGGRTDAVRPHNNFRSCRPIMTRRASGSAHAAVAAMLVTSSRWLLLCGCRRRTTPADNARATVVAHTAIRDADASDNGNEKMATTTSYSCIGSERPHRCCHLLNNFAICWICPVLPLKKLPLPPWNRGLT